MTVHVRESVGGLRFAHCRLTLSSGHATLPLIEGLGLVLGSQFASALACRAGGWVTTKAGRLEGYYEDYGFGFWFEDDWCGDE